jgi:hypothetical protein
MVTYIFLIDLELYQKNLNDILPDLLGPAFVGPFFSGIRYIYLKIKYYIKLRDSVIIVLMIKLLLFLLLLLNTNFIYGQASAKKPNSKLVDGWLVIAVKDGFTIYTKKSKKSMIRSMRIQGVVNAKVSKITSILRDVPSAKSWVPNLINRSYVDEISDTEVILYDITDMPWPITDRDMVVHHKLKLSSDKKSIILYFKSIVDERKAVDSEYVRAKIHYGTVEFSPINDDKTQVEMIMLVDPMGAIPTWAVNVLQVSMPYDFLMSLNKFAMGTKVVPLPGVQKLLDQLIFPKNP